MCFGKRTIEYRAGSLLLSLLLAACAFARTPEQGPDDVTLDMPCHGVRWARPLRGGPIRALLVAPRGALRDAAGLAERLDLEMDVVGLWDRMHPDFDAAGPSDTLSRRVERALDASPQVLIAGNFDLAQLPAALQQRIVDKVASGMGLVIAFPECSAPGPLRDCLDRAVPVDAAADLLRGVGFSGVHDWEQASKQVRTAAHHTGRLALLDYPGDRPETHFLIPLPVDPMSAFTVYLDNAFALVIRAVLWSARRESPIMITRIVDVSPEGPAEDEIPPDLPPAFIQSMRNSVMNQPLRPYVLQLDRPADRPYRVTVQVRRAEAAVSLPFSASAPIAKGSANYPLDLLIGPGEYFVDTWISDKKGILDWFTGPVTVTGWPQLSEVTYGKSYLLPNDTLDLSAAILPTFSTTRRCSVYARATDAYGRRVAEGVQPLSSEGGEARIRLGFADLLSPLLKIEVFALDGPPRAFAEWELNCADRDCRFLTVRMPRRTQNISLVAVVDHPEEYNSRQYLDILSGLGVDTVCAPASEAALFHTLGRNLGFLPEVSRYLPGNTLDDIRTPCLSDPEYRSREGRTLRERATTAWAGGTGLYSLGQGNCLSATGDEVCCCATCVAGFRKMLQDRYRVLAALNSAWGTQFRTWDEVVPGDSAAARASGHYAPYVAFRTYMDNVFTDFLAYGRQCVRSVDRSGQVGFLPQAFDAPTLGYNWSGLAASLDFMAAAPSSSLTDRLRSYFAPGAYNGLTFGGDYPPPNEATARWLPWFALFHGIPSLWCTASFAEAGHPLLDSALYPDGRPTPFFRTLAETAAALRSGPGALLLAASRSHCDIALYDSQASRHLNDVDAVFKTSSRQSEAGFTSILRTLGYQYDYVGRRGLRPETLRRYRALILPMARALSNDEVSAIREFAVQGGALIADVPPAEYDEFGLTRGRPALEDLFAETGLGSVTPNENPRAILVSLPQEGASAERLRRFLDNTGCKPMFDGVLDNAGTFCGEWFRLRYGPADLLGLIADPHAQNTQKLHLAFADSAPVYDLTAPKRLRKPHKATAVLQPGEARLYSLLPYQVSGIAVTAPKRVVAGQRLRVQLLVSTDGPLPGTHLVQLDLQRDQGSALPYYRRLVQCAKGSGEVYIPLARNERPGQYWLAAQDLLSGVHESAAVRISGRAE